MVIKIKQHNIFFMESYKNYCLADLSKTLYYGSKNKITVVFRQIIKEYILAAIHREVTHPLKMCIEQNRGNFEHYLD